MKILNETLAEIKAPLLAEVAKEPTPEQMASLLAVAKRLEAEKQANAR